ncbi:FBP domain-containing protein [Streptomyces sp. Vc74B-19]|uniref:FBP domain-containing protein n=1 Tax=unclassified Streptomyces TaxID=2593676 RepID=UPI001BFC3BA0|nr:MULTISPECIES: FBP domain-containing protein [unclassified Streptomyces]MBT3162966.1 FBP domain-containing protein [Streptomyces sp. Vc74B-19]MCO4699475.1 FBP domain-containing protein [Streptomyces sp. RO-S4]MDU0302759.1 FBP domain-containing protein [Streptomyces sp. PAL114]
MRALTEQDIRGSFINCSKGEAKRLNVPRDLGERPWDDLDFLGWRDPGAPDRSYVVVERQDGLVGVAMRFQPAQRGFLHRSMCSLCLTTHPRGGVSLMTARKAGPAGREGNSVGAYMCTDLACSLYLRGLKVPETGARFEESLTLEQQIDRTTGNLLAFIGKL